MTGLIKILPMLFSYLFSYIIFMKNFELLSLNDLENINGGLSLGGLAVGMAGGAATGAKAGALVAGPGGAAAGACMGLGIGGIAATVKDYLNHH